jgi:hypothetical protein
MITIRGYGVAPLEAGQRLWSFTYLIRRCNQGMKFPYSMAGSGGEGNVRALTGEAIRHSEDAQQLMKALNKALSKTEHAYRKAEDAL